MYPDASHIRVALQSPGNQPYTLFKTRLDISSGAKVAAPPWQGEYGSAGQQQAVEDVHKRLDILFAPCASCEKTGSHSIIKAVKTFRIAAIFLLLSTVGLCGDKGFNPPPAGAAASYPLHEAHDDEKVTIAIDPFTSPEKAAVFKRTIAITGFCPYASSLPMTVTSR